MSKPPVLILGARSDIALALAHAFARRGHPLMLGLRDPDRMADAEADLELRYKAEVTRHAFDAADPASFAAFFDGLPATPHIVVSAVGAMPEQDATVSDPALAAEVIAANFTGPALALEEAARRLSAIPRRTAVIGISSVAGDRGRAKNYAYGAAKAGFSAWLSGLRQKYAGSKLLVMTVKPGFVRTAMTAGLKLPGPVTVSADKAAAVILQGLDARRPVIYTPRWRWIMLIIRALPEGIFQKLKF
ncbi:MAG: SDR family NAD(P)-dependent oxidoreductase [Pseudomonadota bacterium]